MKGPTSTLRLPKPPCGFLEFRNCLLAIAWHSRALTPQVLKLVLRPPRAIYTVDQLGTPLFTFQGNFNHTLALNSKLQPCEPSLNPFETLHSIQTFSTNAKILTSQIRVG